MRQIGISEKIDSLTRIQEEIKEVARREQELRELLGTAGPAVGDDLPDVDVDDDDDDDDDLHHHNRQFNGSSSGKICTDLETSPLPSSTTTSSLQDDINTSQTPSLTSSVNSKESLDEHHSDDSGISASSSPVNGTSANGKAVVGGVTTTTTTTITPIHGIGDKKYIRSNGYNATPLPPAQKLLTRTVSTPQIFTPNRRTIAFGPAHKGVMQRFIASRGKIALNNNNSNNSNGNATPLSAQALTGAMTNNNAMTPDFRVRNPAVAFIPEVTMTPPVIERDADGKPIRRGYIPVEEKIQRELRDLKSRENELKKIRKIRQSTPDLLDSIDNENLESDEDDSEVEHCYGPGKLRSAKSIGELCDSANSNNSMSPRTTPSPDFDSKLQYSRGSGMRPAMSLAQLCDLDPEEAPSSHRLIAQWENLIQQNA